MKDKERLLSMYNPIRFKIETPIGSYNLDWAVVINEFNEEKAKIKCAKKHFEALGKEVVFMAPENNPDEFIKKLNLHYLIIKI